MGFSASHWLEKQIKMKFIAIACLTAVAFAEPDAKADPDAALLYGGYYGGYGLGYAGYGLGYAGYGYPYAAGYYGHYLGKRSADAEPEADADAALLYGAYGYGGYGLGYAGYGYGAYPYAAGYAYGGYPYAYGAYYGKRSADAEPEAEADAALLYGAYGYGGYGLGYAGYGYGAYPYAAGYAYGGYPYA